MPFAEVKLNILNIEVSVRTYPKSFFITKPPTASFDAVSLSREEKKSVIGGFTLACRGVALKLDFGQ